MTDYNVKHTDRTVPSIAVPETEVNDTALGVTLFGRINPEYGQLLDEDLLNILENFACPEHPTLSTDFDVAMPDLTKTSKTQLTNPTTGQFWFNSTRDMMYYWTGERWYPLPIRENYAANWGSVIDGQQLPRPVSPVTGHVFAYEDCIWSVAPAAFTGRPAFVSCATDNNATVTMQYRLAGTNTVLQGLANYLIIGIRGNYNTGQNLPPINLTPTPTPTMSLTPGASVTPTPTMSVTPTPTLTAAATTTPTPTPGVSVTPTSTPPVSPTSTPAATVTPTASPINPSVTPTRTPTPTPLPPMFLCPCPGMGYWGGAYYPSMSGENYNTLAECEIVRNALYPAYWCDSTFPYDPEGAQCWSIINPNIQEAYQFCILT